MKDAIKPGIYYGLISILISILLYLIDPTIMIKIWFGLFMIALGIGILIYFGLSYRKSIGGYLEFKDAFLFCLTLCIVAGAMSTLFNLLLFNVIDPELPQKLADAAIEQTERMMVSFGVPEEAIDEAMSKAKDETLKRFSVVGSLISFLWSILGFALFSVIVGAIIRKKKPEFE